MLVTLNTANSDLAIEQKKAVRAALANIITLEQKVEAELSEPTGLRSARFNRVVSRDIDRLQTVLVEIKIARAGVGS